MILPLKWPRVPPPPMAEVEWRADRVKRGADGAKYR